MCEGRVKTAEKKGLKRSFLRPLAAKPAMPQSPGLSGYAIHAAMAAQLQRDPPSNARKVQSPHSNTASHSRTSCRGAERAGRLVPCAKV